MCIVYIRVIINQYKHVQKAVKGKIGYRFFHNFNGHPNIYKLTSNIQRKQQMLKYLYCLSIIPIASFVSVIKVNSVLKYNQDLLCPWAIMNDKLLIGLWNSIDLLAQIKVITPIM